MPKTVSPPWPRDSHFNASGKHGAVQRHVGLDICRLWKRNTVGEAQGVVFSHVGVGWYARSVNNNALREKPENKSAGSTHRSTGAVLEDGTVVELLFDPVASKTALAVWNGESWRRENEVTGHGGERLLPYDARNSLIRYEVVLLPSAPEEYGTEADLTRDIQDFIHRYVDVSPAFERIATQYILLSWIYDTFNEVPYLRLRGDYGTGKTRFLLIVGSLCYKPIFASGASTVSPLFHILNAFRGALVLDEGDFRMSDEKAEVVKILNQGSVRGFPVLRTEVSRTGEFNPRAFHVFGPKIVVSRGTYDDRALESRFITEETGQHELRRDVPISLPSAYKDEARALRNKLLLYRFHNRGRRSADESCLDASIEPRLRQMFAPLLAIVDDPTLRRELQARARQYHRDLALDRAMDTEAQVLEVIRDLFERPNVRSVSIKQITETFASRFADEYGERVTNRWIGTIIRKKLGLRPHKSHGVFVVSLSELPKLNRLLERYDLASKQQRTEENSKDTSAANASLPVVAKGDNGAHISDREQQ